MSDLIGIHCDNCGNDGGDDGLYVLREVVGQLAVGARPDRSIVPDGPPEHLDVVADHGRQIVWCNACGNTTVPIHEDGDDDDTD